MGCSCTDWEAVKAGPWDFTATRCGIWGSTGLSMGGVRAGCTPLMLKDSDRGGSAGSDILLATLCGKAGELCRFSRERSSTSLAHAGFSLGLIPSL